MRLSEQEIQSGAMSAENLALTLRILHDVGYVVLEDVVPMEWVNRARAACDAELERYVAEGEGGKHLEERWGQVSMLAPMQSPYTDPVCVENPFALQVMEAAMGSDLYCAFYNTNTSWPGSTYQPLHRDIYHLFPDYPAPLPVSMIVVNFPLVDFNEENGSTEVYPGTHLITDIDPADNKRLEERAKLLPAVRTNVNAGSLVVRDMRMWHRGMPNNSKQIRTMLAIVYARRFWMLDPRMNEIPRGTWEEMSEKSKHLFRFNRILEEPLL
jgi:ectoine hydroxylase-related dioxygenase (phytanoyl-CoA dioxygenase family)